MSSCLSLLHGDRIRLQMETEGKSFVCDLWTDLRYTAVSSQAFGVTTKRHCILSKLFLAYGEW